MIIVVVMPYGSSSWKSIDVISYLLGSLLKNFTLTRAEDVQRHKEIFKLYSKPSLRHF